MHAIVILLFQRFNAATQEFEKTCACGFVMSYEKM